MEAPVELLMLETSHRCGQSQRYGCDQQTADVAAIPYLYASAVIVSCPKLHVRQRHPSPQQLSLDNGAAAAQDLGRLSLFGRKLFWN